MLEDRHDGLQPVGRSAERMFARICAELAERDLSDWPEEARAEIGRIAELAEPVR